VLELNSHVMNGTIRLLIVLLLITCMISVCAGAVTPIRSDGQLRYAEITSSNTDYSLKPWGHAVFFINEEPIVIKGVRLYAFRYGDLQANVSIEIWDENLTTLYKDVILYEKLPLHQAINENDAQRAKSWQTIPLPDHLVTDDFYLVIFTNSYAMKENKRGIAIYYTAPSTSGTSHTVKSNPNRIDELTMNMWGKSFPPTDVDWMIRVLYSQPVVTNTVQEPTPLKETVQPTISMQALAQTSPVSTQSITSQQTSPVSPQSIPASPLTSVPTPTKATIEIPVVILTIVFSLYVFRRV